MPPSGKIEAGLRLHAILCGGRGGGNRRHEPGGRRIEWTQGVFAVFLTFKKWTAIYVLCLLGLFAGFAAILWHGSAVNASKNIVLSGGGTVLIVDPGHGGEDGGAVSQDGTPESGINLAIALRMKALAEFLGREMVLTRETDISLHGEDARTLAEKKRQDLQNRAALCAGIENGVLVSIHQNSLPEFPDTSGAQVFYNGEGDSEALAQGLQDALNQSVNLRAKTCRPMGDGVYLLEHAGCPAVLVECGFLSNPEETMRLKDPGYQTRLAFVVLAATMEHIDSQAG